MSYFVPILLGFLHNMGSRQVHGKDLISGWDHDLMEGGNAKKFKNSSDFKGKASLKLFLPY